MIRGGTPRLAALAALAATAAAAGCSDDEIDPITKITGPRVLAIVTEPSALEVGSEVRLTALVVDRDGPRLGVGSRAVPGERPVAAVRMRACAPWRFIADPARDCTGAGALPLPTDGAGHVTASSAALEAAFPAPPGASAPPDPWRTALAAGVALRVPIIAEIDVDGQTLIARRDLEVVAAGVERKNPRPAELRFDGAAATTLRAGQRYALTATLDPDSLDRAPGAGVAGSREAADLRFYSPAGELAEPAAALADPDAPVPESSPTAYTPGPPGRTWLFVVVTDESGGMGAAAFPLVIE